jgi:hypothetical protein
MNSAQHAAISKVLRNIADELDELALVVDSMSDDPESETIDDFYLKFTDAWYWTNNWLDEQGINNENSTRLQ